MAPKLTLSVAVGDYERTRPLIDGTVQIDGVEHLGDTAATKVTLPFVEEQLRDARQFMGADFWSYGLAPNRHVLEAFHHHHHDQGLSWRLVQPDELFHPSTYETVKV